ncbi:NAM domain-containing protein, partial [Cephalotus follicularis]
EKEWYFFVERDDWYPKGSGPNRKAGFDGKWKQTGNDKEIYCHDQKIGYKTELVFIKQGLFFGGGVGQRTNWIMHEYKVEKETSAAADGIKDVPTSSTAAHHIKVFCNFLAIFLIH